jgi:hypothetical protein
MYKEILFIIICFTVAGCKDKNKFRWTSVEINVSPLTSEELPDSIRFTVGGHKSGDGYITKSDGSLEIHDYILNGKYKGGFVSKTSGRWHYDFSLEREFRDSFYMSPKRSISMSLKKRTNNIFDFQVSKYKSLVTKSFLSTCTGIGDNIKYLLRHKDYDPTIDMSTSSSEWESGTYRYWINGCDTNSRIQLLPTGKYEIAVKTTVQEIETGYYKFEFEIFKDSTNTLDLFY